LRSRGESKCLIHSASMSSSDEQQQDSPSPKRGQPPSPSSVSDQQHPHDDDDDEPDDGGGSPDQQKQHADLSDDSGIAVVDSGDDDNDSMYDDHHHHHDDEDDDDEEMEIHGLVSGLSGSTPNQSMSIGGGDSLISDDDLHHHGGISGGIWRNTSAEEYEYDYIDEDGIFMPGGGGHRGNRGHSWWCSKSTRSLLYSPKLLCLIAAFLIVSLLAIFLPDQPQETQGDPPVVRKYKGAPQYSCPAAPTDETTASTTTTTTTTSSGNNYVIPKYQNNSTFLLNLADNLTTTYTQTFRDLEFRDWNKTFSEVKESLVHWKTSRFVPNLKTGDSIFESGCGIGLGLLMTLEILQEQNKNLRDLHLYGSDASAAATNAGNVVLDKILGGEADVGGGKRGVLCAADATHLDFIPSDTFDLVFSSRVAPLPDPFGMMDNSNNNINVTAELVMERRREVCQTLLTDWKSAALQRAAQERQSDWYGRWVSELVRGAKPGAPIAVEQVSDPYCDEHVMDEWGVGVPYSFWNDAVQAYGWDVDPESIEFDMDTLFPSTHRYHVFMRKNRH